MNLKETLLQNNYSIIASNGYYSTDDGIKPVITKVIENKDYFKDLSVVDRVIGKASASLFIYSGVKEVYGLVISISAKQLFEKYNIPYKFDTLVEYIENRNKDGMCPMEMTVKDIDDLEQAFVALRNKIAL